MSETLGFCAGTELIFQLVLKIEIKQFKKIKIWIGCNNTIESEWNWQTITTSTYKYHNPYKTDKYYKKNLSYCSSTNKNFEESTTITTIITFCSTMLLLGLDNYDKNVKKKLFCFCFI
jgi:hypothetical protein